MSSNAVTLWELPEEMSPADRLSVESILRHAGGKKRTFHEEYIHLSVYYGVDKNLHSYPINRLVLVEMTDEQ